MSLVNRIILLSAGGGADATAKVNQQIAIAVLFAIVAIVFGLLAGGYWLINLTAAYATMLALMGTNLLFGQLGLVSLAQFALVGIGGWVTLRLFHAFHLPFEISMLAGGVIASIVGVIWGLPALRFRGIYLALVTLMLSGAFQVFISAANYPSGGTGILGTGGMEGRPRLLLDRSMLAPGDHSWFFYVAAVCLIGLIIVELHRNSKPGRAWALIRKDPRLAAASGVRILFYQTWAFALAGFLAGIGGALLAGTYRQLDATGFGASESITLFAASVLGGTTNWVGTLVGGLLTRAVPTVLDTAGVPATVGNLLFGFGLMMAVIGGPTGIAGLFDDLVDRILDRNAKDT
jgi:branched-chain amino acid transport system permease protein